MTKMQKAIFLVPLLVFMTSCSILPGVQLVSERKREVLLLPDNRVHQNSTLNVIMLIADDMRPQFDAMKGPFFPGTVHPSMNTPNLDRLASESALFRRAYVQFPLCGPSRGSFLTGRRPNTSHQYGFTPFRVLGYNLTTIPQYFKENGYLSYGIGKIFHRTAYHESENLPWGDESELAFSELNFWPPSDVYWNDELEKSWMSLTDEERSKSKHPQLPDEQARDKAIEKLKELGPKAKNGELNFMLSVGFRKPHVPYICPAKYFDIYPENTNDLPANPFLPVDFPEIAWFDYLDLRRRKDLVDAGVTGEFNTTMSDEETLKLRRAYYACISYVDDLIGDILAEVEAQGLKENTAIVFISDHGYNLGENMEWTKEMLWDLSTHSPLMIHIPGLTDSGYVIDSLVEYVDIFPTLAEVAGLPTVPLCPESNADNTATCHEGMSLMSLIQAGEKYQSVPWKNRVFTQTSRPPESKTTVMGHSMTTERYRYTEWIGTDYHSDGNFEFNWEDVYGTELYDHFLDPEENINRANDDSYKNVKNLLHRYLRAGWRDALS